MVQPDDRQGCDRVTVTLAPTSPVFGDAAAERAVLAAVLQQPATAGEVFALLRPEQFTGPFMDVARLLRDLAEEGTAVDPMVVLAAARERGVDHRVTGPLLADLHGLPVAPASAGLYARMVADAAARRDGWAIAARAQQQFENRAVPVAETTALTMAQLDEITLPDRGLVQPPYTLGEFLDGPTAHDWLIPDLFERGDRLILTGTEGGGKSMLCRQIAVCAACGVHPFTGRVFNPVRTLLVDLENGIRTVRRKLAPMAQIADGMTRPARDLLFVESKPNGLDLVNDPSDLAWLLGVCEQARAALLVIGPLYRLHRADINDEQEAMRLLRAIDTIRGRLGVTVVTEAHAPHKEPGRAARDMRPVGSSAFKRWPEFGFGLRESREKSETGAPLWDFVAWRGARDERTWPRVLRWGRGAEWPWVDVDEGGWL